MLSISPRTLLIGVLIASAVAVLAAFAYTRVFSFASGPGLVVQIPQAEISTASEPIAPIEGYAPRATEISVNGAGVFLNESGEFHDRVPLSDGYNIVTVTATDRFGSTETQRRVIMYPPR